MDSDRWERLQHQFLEIRAAHGAERTRLLDAIAREDAELAAELHSLLAADGETGVLDAAVLPSLVLQLREPVPDRIGPYIVMGEVGRGGMGVVCRAHDPRLRRDVAIKLLQGSRADDETSRKRFLAEARAASALDHPNICTIYDTGTLEDGRVWIAMALYSDGNLADRLATGPMPVQKATTIAVQVADALAAAHDAGVVHLDVKPRNIAFGDRGEPRLLDFGIARLGADSGNAVDSTGGTPAYMAPEQARGERVDRRTDVWALGVLLFEMLAGSRPFAAGDTGALVSSNAADETPDVRARAPGVPRGIARVVARALRPNPADRYATARDFQLALRKAEASAGRRTLLRRRGGPIAAAVVVLAAALLLNRPDRDRAVEGLDHEAVVILPFRVSGDASLAYLREGMPDLLAARLTGETGLRAADPGTVHSAWRRLYGGRTQDLPIDSAVRFARELGVARVLLGDVVAAAGSMSVNATLLDENGGTVSRAGVQGPSDALPELVDRLVGQLLSLGAGEDPHRLAALASTSLPALRAYLAGQAEYRNGRYEQALLRYSEALQYDTTFALAGMGLGMAAGWVSGADGMRERGHAIAWRNRERLSTRDRALLVANVGPDYPRSPTVEQLLQAIEHALGIAPDRAELWHELGDLHFHFGRVVASAEWPRKAEGALRRAIELDPVFAPAMHHLVALYAAGGRSAELRAAAGAYEIADSVGATADYIRWRTAAAQPAGAAHVVLDSLNSETLGWIAMNTFDDGFAVDQGLRAAELLAARSGTNAQEFERRMGLYSALLSAGRRARARTTADAMRDIQPEPGFVHRLHILSAMYGDGDADAAVQSVAALDRQAANDLDRCVLLLWSLNSRTAGNEPPAPHVAGADTSVESTGFTVCRAVAEATDEVRRTSRAGPAVDTLDRLLRSGLVTGPVIDGHTEYAHIALARLREQTGDPAGALEAIRRRLYFIGWQPYLAASLREECRLADIARDSDAGRRACVHFLALRFDPDPQLRGHNEAVRATLGRFGVARTPDR